MNVLGLDPGLATGGMVLLGAQKLRDEVLGSHSLVDKKGVATAAQAEARELARVPEWGDFEFTAAVLRAERWLGRFQTVFEAWREEFGIDVIAVESFVDQRSRAREEQKRLVRNRWQTPLLIGEITSYLREQGYSTSAGTLVWQNAGIVIRQWSREIAQLENRRAREKDVIFSGDHQVGNDHERKALAHAAALSLRLKRAQRR